MAERASNIPGDHLDAQAQTPQQALADNILSAVSVLADTSNQSAEYGSHVEYLKNIAQALKSGEIIEGVEYDFLQFIAPHMASLTPAHFTDLRDFFFLREEVWAGKKGTSDLIAFGDARLPEEGPLEDLTSKITAHFAEKTRPRF